MMARIAKWVLWCVLVGTAFSAGGTPGSARADDRYWNRRGGWYDNESRPYAYRRYYRDNDQDRYQGERYYRGYRGERSYDSGYYYPRNEYYPRNAIRIGPFGFGWY